MYIFTYTFILFRSNIFAFQSILVLSLHPFSVSRILSLSDTHTHSFKHTHTYTPACVSVFETNMHSSLKYRRRTDVSASYVTYESCHVRVMSSKSRITYNICNLVMTVHRRLCESCHVWVMSRMSHVTYITYMQFSHVKCESCHSWRNMWHNKQKWAIQRHIQMSHLCVCHRSSIKQK